MQAVTRQITLTVPVPFGVLLPAKAVSLYGALRLLAHNGGEACASIETLGALIGQRPGGRLTSYLRTLRDAGLIEVIRGRRVLHYRMKV